jgi:hypothetical protein
VKNIPDFVFVHCCRVMVPREDSVLARKITITWQWREFTGSEYEHQNCPRRKA